jgi:hypothetical protein
MSLMPVPPEQTGATCPHCSAPIVSDQRYCLTCGQPCAPVRLAFLDVLQSEQRAPAGSGWASQELGGPIPDGYGSPGDESALQRWLRRYSGVFGVLGVLLLAIVIGLLVGHWVTQGNTPSKQVVEVKGLPTVAAAAAAAPAATTPTPAASTTSKSAEAAEEAKEAKEAKEEEKKPAKAPTKAVKVSPAQIKKLESTGGKQHQEELNKLGDQPIETGG